MRAARRTGGGMGRRMIEKDEDPIAPRIFQGSRGPSAYAFTVAIDARVYACACAQVLVLMVLVRTDAIRCIRGVPASVTNFCSVCACKYVCVSLSFSLSYTHYFLALAPSSLSLLRDLFFVPCSLRSLVTSDRFHALPAFLGYCRVRVHTWHGRRVLGERRGR